MADIGTDHGLLPVSLVLSGRVPLAIAMDIALKPLTNAINNAQHWGVDESALLTRLSDGFSALRLSEVTTVTMSGMGGARMDQILRSEPQKAASFRRLVLQPNTGAARLRMSLSGFGWTICDEAMIYEKGRYYPVIVAERGESTLSESDLMFGPVLRRKASDEFLNWLNQELEYLTDRLAEARINATSVTVGIERLASRLALVKVELSRLGIIQDRHQV